MEETNAENNIVLCKTGMHPPCDRGIQLWSKNLEEISVEMAGRWTAKIIKGKEKHVYEQKQRLKRVQNKTGVQTSACFRKPLKFLGEFLVCAQMLLILAKSWKIVKYL